MKSRYKYTIIITSDEPWSDMWHTQLHYAFELSRTHNVIFLNPPLPGFNINHNISFKSIKINDNLKVINYIKILPVHLGKLSMKINDFFTCLSIKNIIDNKENKIILWRLDHFRLHNLYLLNIAYKIYHVIDHWIKFEEDVILAKTSDLVIFTSPRLESHYRKLNSNIINIPQGISDDEFNVNPNTIEEIKEKYKSFLFASGTFSDTVDLNILRKVANRFSDLKLLLAGSQRFGNRENKRMFEDLISMKSVVYLDIIPGRNLKNYISASVACLIHYPFEEECIRSPLKVLNYIAQFKPVVTSYKTEIDSLEGKGIFTATSVEDYLFLLEKIIENKVEIDIEAIRKYLVKVRYENLIKTILAKVEQN